MIYAFFMSFIAALLFSGTSIAYQSPEITFTIGNARVEAAQTENIKGLETTRLEAFIKNDLARKRLNTPKIFFSEKANLENPELRQSFFNETDEALAAYNKPMGFNSKMNFYVKFIQNSPIEIARRIAKKKVFFLILDKWDILKDTIFNEYSFENKKDVRKFVADLTQKTLVYQPRPKASAYLFMLGDSYVEIDKNLKRGRMGLDVNSRLDTNTLAPAAQNIKADDDDVRKGSGSENKSANSFPSAPLPKNDPTHFGSSPQDSDSKSQNVATPNNPAPNSAPSNDNSDLEFF